MTLKDLEERLFQIIDKYEITQNCDLHLSEEFIRDVEDLLKSGIQYRIDRKAREDARKEFNKIYYETLQEEQDKLKKFKIKNEEVEDTSSIFYDKSVVFTGDLNGVKREVAAEYIHSKGGILKDSISSKTDIVIIGSIAPGPSKLKKLEEFINAGKDIRKIDEEEFINISGLK